MLNNSKYRFTSISRSFTKGIAILFLLVPAGVLMAQGTAERALGKEDIQTIYNQFSSQVEICVPGTQGSFAKDKARDLLSGFFNKYDVQAYKTMHSGVSKTQDSNYSIGELITNQKKFRVYVYYDDTGSSKVIKELCIE